MNDPDGTRRTVDYTADDVNGFNAVVRKTPQFRTAHVVAPAVETRVASVVPAVSVANVAHVSGVSHVANVAPAYHVASVQHVAPVVNVAHSSVASDVSALKSVSNVSPVESNVISDDTVEVGSPVSQLSGASAANVVPETRYTETGNSVVHNIPLSEYKFHFNFFAWTI